MAPQQPLPPPAKGMTRSQYYGMLVSQGMDPAAAFNAMQQQFGPPKSPDQLAKDQQMADLAQVGGAVVGTIGIPYIAGQLGFGAGAGAGAAGAGAGAAGAGAAGAGGAYTGGVGGMAGMGSASSAGATTTGASTLGSIGSVALPAAAIIAGLSETWEGGGKDILRGRGNKQDWTNMGVNAVGGVLPNMVLRWMGKPSIGRMMTSGKSDAQLLRDDFRGALKSSGMADDDYNITLANGTKFNIGLDGKTKYENTDGTKRNAWDVDLTNPLAKYAVGVIDPKIRSLYSNESGYSPEQFTGMIVNAVTSNAKNEKEVKANIDKFLASGTMFGGDKNKPAALTKPTTPAPRPVKPEEAEKSVQAQQKVSVGDLLRNNMQNRMG